MMDELKSCERCGTYGIDATTEAESHIQFEHGQWLCGVCAAKLDQKPAKKGYTRITLEKVELDGWLFDITVDYKVADQGIGSYEFWGAKGNDSRMGVDEFEIIDIQLLDRESCEDVPDVGRFNGSLIAWADHYHSDAICDKIQDHYDEHRYDGLDDRTEDD